MVGVGAVVMAAVLFVVGFGLVLMSPLRPGSRAALYVRVSPGQTAAQVGVALQRRQVIRSALAFTLLSRINGAASHLTAGVYRLSPSQSLAQILRIMGQGRVVVVRVPIPEGLTVQAVVERLEQHHIGTPSQYRVLLKHPLKGMPRPQAGVRDPLEGYLFPATYAFSYGVTARQALTEMWQTFDARMIRGLYDRRPRKLSLVQWVTLASIVQSEAKNPAQDRLVAAVFLNRLKIRMPLQSDATVRYAVGGMPPGGLVPADFSRPSPYNTYSHAGLPPGPIANPGRAALLAVLHPAHVPYLYFVSLRSGRILFGTTYAQQLANIRYAKTHPNA